MNGRSGIKALPLVIAVAAVGGLAWFGFAKSGILREQKEVPIEGAPVQRGPLRISVIERGNLKAADSVSLKSEIEGQSTILFLVPEGTAVKEGDVVCELDVTSLIDKRFQQEISVRNAEAAFVKAKQNYEIQKSQNDSDIKKAEQNEFFADTDLRKFLEGERKATEDRADETIKLAEEEYTRAEEKVGWSEKLYEKGFLTNTELEADRLSLSRAQIQLEQAKRDKDLLVRFQLPRDQSELTSLLDEAHRELERVKLQAAARIVDFEADMRTKEAQLQLEKEKLDKLERQIDKAKLIAPRAGMAVYAQEEGGRYGMSQPIKEGTNVRERQEIVTIPSAAGMIAQVSLHESVLKQVQSAQRCIVKIDALGTHEFHGHVSFVAVLPDQNSWFANPNTRLYRTEVQIEDGSADMRPGMSCQVEILVEDIADTLYVPVTAVFRTGNDNVCFVSTKGRIDERKVEVGRYNDRWVQILSGVKEGELVLLSRPKGFDAQAAPAGNTPEATPPGPAGANGAPAAPPPTASAQAPGAPTASPMGERPAGEPRGERGNDQRSGENRSGNRPAFAEGQGPSEEMRKRWEAMTPEQKEEARKRFGEGRGNRGGGDRPGGGEEQKGASESKSDG